MQYRANKNTVHKCLLGENIFCCVLIYQRQMHSVIQRLRQLLKQMKQILLSRAIHSIRGEGGRMRLHLREFHWTWSQLRLSKLMQHDKDGLLSFLISGQIYECSMQGRKWTPAVYLRDSGQSCVDMALMFRWAQNVDRIQRLPSLYSEPLQTMQTGNSSGTIW